MSSKFACMALMQPYLLLLLPARWLARCAASVTTSWRGASMTPARVSSATSSLQHRCTCEAGSSSPAGPWLGHGKATAVLLCHSLGQGSCT